jgi:isocitrate dehydrogenase (NAD+)
MRYTVTELQGDGISPELAVAVREVCRALPIDVAFESIDLSVASRKAEGMAIYDRIMESMRRNRFALKYPTATVAESPNAVLRDRCSFSVIYRPVSTIPGVPTNFKKDLSLHVVRIATGGTYDDPGRLIGTEAAVSLRIVERRPCWQAARYAFHLARRLGVSMTSASKHTIQKATDGLFESIVDEVGKDFPDVPQQEELFDALLAKIVMNPERYSVILVLNEYGDFLSDMACGLAGSIGIGASSNLSFAADEKVELALFDPVGGTAPDIAGKNLANPTAIFLALAMLVAELGHPDLSVALEKTVLSLLSRGICTRDLGGKLSTSEFTSQVASELKDAIR